MIEIQDLHKAYGDRKAVDGVSFAVEEEIFGVLGPNGAGKTTTVECVAGLRVPDGGTVRVAGLDPVTRHEEVTRLLGVQLQQSELQPKLTVREALGLYASFHDRPADWRVLVERLGLEGQLGTRFGRLSGGQKQRLFVALALGRQPRSVPASFSTPSWPWAFRPGCPGGREGRRGAPRTIAELAGTNARLEQALAENAALQAQLLVQAREAGVADERRRLAAEIHDTLAQGLTGIIAQLQAADAGGDPGQARVHLHRAADLARHSLREARRSVRTSVPSPWSTTPSPRR
ncbi:Vitamin B12 import ATP-binding protein BtuD [Streptomyces glaucescens]